MSVVAVLGIALTCLITTMPLLIAVTVAVCSRDTRRRADARQIVRLLRPTPRRHHPALSDDVMESTLRE
jgi:hypothetical protein